MSNDGRHARLHEFFGCGDRLGRIAVIVDHQELDLLAEHAARRVQFSDLPVHALLHLLAEPGHAAGHRARRADQNLGLSERGGPERRSKCNDQMCEEMLHGLLPPTPAALSARSYHDAGACRKDCGQRHPGTRPAPVSPGIRMGIKPWSEGTGCAESRSYSLRICLIRAIASSTACAGLMPSATTLWTALPQTRSKPTSKYRGSPEAIEYL